MYQPVFPNQQLGEEPDLILSPPVSSQAQPGSGIDSQDPHSITRLHVDYLGFSEILLAACDDGDVVGYSIKDIHRAVAQQKDDDDQDDTQSHVQTGVRLLFQRNVGKSAWGLAVHREARMIAISANTHKVTVLAWALADLENTNNVHSDIPSFAPSDDGSKFPRQIDCVITISASTNIPSVAFCNNGHDPTGNLLITSSIDGKTMMWNLQHPTAPRRVFQLGWCDMEKNSAQAPGLGPGFCRCFDRDMLPHCAWGAMVLDTRHLHNLERPPEDRTVISPGFKDVTPLPTKFSSAIYSNHAIGLSVPTASNGTSSDVADDQMELESQLESEDEVSGSDDENEEPFAIGPVIQPTAYQSNAQPLETNTPAVSVSAGGGGVDPNSLFLPPISSIFAVSPP